MLDKLKKRYVDAHYMFNMTAHKEFYEQSGCYAAKMPNINKANGLTMFICNYLKWSGWHSNRINTMGRLIDTSERQPSGVFLKTKKFIPTTTRKGTADIAAIIKGKSIHFEIKIGKDKPSEAQLREQAAITKAGGYYYFINNIEQFFEIYDKFLLCTENN